MASLISFFNKSDIFRDKLQGTKFVFLKKESRNVNLCKYKVWKQHFLPSNAGLVGLDELEWINQSGECVLIYFLRDPLLIIFSCTYLLHLIFSFSESFTIEIGALS